MNMYTIDCTACLLCSMCMGIESILQVVPLIDWPFGVFAGRKWSLDTKNSSSICHHLTRKKVTMSRISWIVTFSIYIRTYDIFFNHVCVCVLFAAAVIRMECTIYRRFFQRTSPSMRFQWIKKRISATGYFSWRMRIFNSCLALMSPAESTCMTMPTYTLATTVPCQNSGLR